MVEASSAPSPMGKPEQNRERFEAAVIERFVESGFLEIEVRVECLSRSGDGYQDGSIDAYWHFFQKGIALADRGGAGAG